MKRIVLWGVLFFVSRVQAQELVVCYDKTVNVIFPYAIVSEDHGSGGIIAQQRKGAAQILHLKANRKNFAPTSVSVVTSDGNLYAFVVRYADDVTQLNYLIDPQQAVTDITIPDNRRILEAEAARIAGVAPNLHNRSRGNAAVLRLRGLYATGHTLWLKTQVISRTVIPFTPAFVKFFIRSTQRAKNTAVQEREIFPVYQQGTSRFAFHPFILDRHQQLVMQAGEQHGGRMLQVRVRAKHFRKVLKRGNEINQ